MEGAECEHVAHRKDRGRTVLAFEQVERCATSWCGCVGSACPDGLLVPRLAEAFLVAVEPLRAEVEGESALRIERAHEREHADALVPELPQVLCGRSGGCTVVDPDERRRRVARLVDGDHRQAAGQRGLDAGVVADG